MPEEERTDRRQLWLCQPRGTPRGTLSNTLQLPGLQQENKTQTCCQSWEKKKKSPKHSKSKTYMRRGAACTPLGPQSSPSRGRGGSPPPLD